jgi:hypothetical protein
MSRIIALDPEMALIEHRDLTGGGRSVRAPSLRESPTGRSFAIIVFESMRLQFTQLFDS